MKRPDSALHATAWHKRVVSFRLSQQTGAVGIKHARHAAPMAWRAWSVSHER